MKKRLKITLILALMVFSMVYYLQRPKFYFSTLKTQREIAGQTVTSIVMTKNGTEAAARVAIDEQTPGFISAGWRVKKKEISSGNDFDDYLGGFFNRKPANQSYVSYEDGLGDETRVYFSVNGDHSAPAASDALSDYCRALRAAGISDFQIVRSKKIKNSKKIIKQNVL